MHARVALMLLVIAADVAGCRRPPVIVFQGAISTESFPVEIRVGPAVADVNRLILGSNVQWVDRGDGLLTSDGTQFNPQALKMVEDLGPTVLRYPGGVLSDTFDWRAGNGPTRSRGTSENYFNRQRQPVLFGTGELLALCMR